MAIKKHAAFCCFCSFCFTLLQCMRKICGYISNRFNELFRCCAECVSYPQKALSLSTSVTRKGFLSCSFQKQEFPQGKTVVIDPCTKCHCSNGTLLCRRYCLYETISYTLVRHLKDFLMQVYLTVMNYRLSAITDSHARPSTVMQQGSFTERMFAADSVV